MSHGSIERCEPNLTPIVDLVLQLVVFMVLVACVFGEWADPDGMELPEAVSAKAWDKSPPTSAFITVNSQGQVRIRPIVADNDGVNFRELGQVESYMQRLAATEVTLLQKRMSIDTDYKTFLGAVYLRIDKRTPFEKSYPIIKACRQAGYSDLYYRVLRYRGED